MMISDWEVVGPEGEYYGRYTERPTGQLPPYAMLREISSPDRMVLGEDPVAVANEKVRYALVGGSIAIASMFVTLLTKDEKINDIARWVELGGLLILGIGIAGLPKHH